MSAAGSAVINSGQQVGGVFGTAILVVILGNERWVLRCVLSPGRLAGWV
ncbi:MAG: hypothetical protein M3Y09_12245 [Actinomycetota bacterium]|nr:hypothetical protein [Actinomycetota bacterium]